MGKFDFGSVPVADGNRLAGMITDRDIAVRSVARGRGPATEVREAMTADVNDVKCCFQDEDVEHVARRMADQ